MKKEKKWIQPKLIVLVRGRPEEGVLSACKTDSQIQPGALNNNCRGLGCGNPACELNVTS